MKSSDQKCDTLSQGGLTHVSSALLPFLEKLLLEINKHINRQKLRKHGKNMVSEALSKITQITDLENSFDTCLKNINVDINESLNNIRIELTKKVFNSRVNEFMEAQKELDLESKGKSTDTDQSLRDMLKTYSSNQSRV